jgi:hypothetical protein
MAAGRQAPRHRDDVAQWTTAMRGQKVTVTVVAIQTGYADGRPISAAVTAQK